MMGLTPNNETTELKLYRRVIPVEIRNIGFVGFTSSVGHWTVSEVASHWISDYFLQRLKLPKSEEMYQEIETTRNFILKIFNRSEINYRYYWPAPIEIYLNDMGINLHRTNNWIFRIFWSISSKSSQRFT